jgi:hypothetical protein
VYLARGDQLTATTNHYFNSEDIQSRSNIALPLLMCERGRGPLSSPIMSTVVFPIRPEALTLALLLPIDNERLGSPWFLSEI